MKRDIFPILFGVIVSTVLAGTLVIAGLKAGITPGVSPLVILCAWGAFASRASSPEGRRFLNLAQVAGSAGMAVTAGVIFVAPLVQILYMDKGLEVPPVDIVTLITLSIAGALVGFGFVGLATKKFLSDPTLPAPEARACEAMIEAAASEKGARPRLGRSLVTGLLLSFLAPLAEAMGLANGHVALMHRERGERTFSLDLPMSPIYIGIGGLLTLTTALLVFGGSFLRLIGDALLAGIDAGTQAAATFPDNSMRWVGGGAMTVAVIYSLKRFMGTRVAPDDEAVGDLSLLEIDPKVRRGLVLSVVIGMAIFLGWLLWKEGGLTLFAGSMTLTILIMATIMVTLGAILSLQIGSSASPVSGTIFVTTLVLCLVALMVGRHSIDDVLLITPLLVGACVAVCAANDSSQDYKTMQLCGVRVQDGFKAQLLGLLSGCIVVPVAVYIAHGAYGLGSPELPAPQGKMFATLVNGLLLDRELPWWPILIGCSIGLLAVVMDIAAGKRGIQLPSMALAVGIYLPASLGIGILIGALFRFLGDRGREQPGESILAAAGLITGAAALELGIGIAILGGYDTERLKIFELGNGTLNAISVLGIVLLGGLLLINSRPQRRS